MIPDYNTFSRHWQAVQEFRRKARQSCPDKPAEPSEAERVLMARLLLEETLETIEALGVASYFDIQAQRLKLRMERLHFQAESPFDMAEVVDGVTDVNYVGTYILAGCGVPDVPFIEMVDANNLAKFSEGHSFHPVTNKLIKPANHPKPPIAEKLAELGWKGAW